MPHSHGSDFIRSYFMSCVLHILRNQMKTQQFKGGVSDDVKRRNLDAKVTIQI